MCLLYHHVLPERVSSKVAATPIGAFRRQMEYLSAHFKLLTVSQLWNEVLEGNWRRRHLLAVTLDDARHSVYENAHPIAAQLGVPLTVFVPTGLIGTADDTGNLDPFMDWRQVVSLAEAGHEIGAHSVSHPHLGSIGLDQARTEIQNSKASLEEIIKRPVTSFAYPYGKPKDAPEAVQNLILAAGFDTAWTTSNGWVVPDCSPGALPRVTLGGSTLWAAFLHHVFLDGRARSSGPCGDRTPGRRRGGRGGPG